MGPGDGSFALILAGFQRQAGRTPWKEVSRMSLLSSSLRGWCSSIDPGAAQQFASSWFPFWHWGCPCRSVVSLQSALEIGFQGWAGVGVVWNMGNKAMKRQGTIRAEVSLSLTFTSRGDDIQEIYMGSGMIINEEEEVPLEAFAGEKRALGSAAEQRLPGHVGVDLGGRDKRWSPRG